MRERHPRIANPWRTYFSTEYQEFARRNRRVSVTWVAGGWYVDAWGQKGPQYLKTRKFKANQHADAIAYAHKIAQEGHR